MGICFLALLALASGAMAALWSISYVNEPYYLAGAFHPTLQGAGKLDFGERFRAQTRLSLSKEAYGLFEPRRDPRAWDVAWSVLGGEHVPFWMGGLEASAGLGAILGQTQGELYYRHDWGGGFFPDKSLEFRRLSYFDAGIPFQVQWLFGKNQKGFGVELSGFISREVRRWGIGYCWQFYTGHAPRPDPIAGPIAPPTQAPGSQTPESGSEAPEPVPQAPAPGSDLPESGREELEK